MPVVPIEDQMITTWLAQGGGFFGDNFEELTAEPLLATACVVLVAVSLEWIFVARLIIRNYRKAARRGLIEDVTTMGIVRNPRDIWSYPPPDDATASSSERSAEYPGR